MEKERIWVLTVIEDGEHGDVFTHLFRKKESAIEYVLDGLKVDYENGDLESEDEYRPMNADEFKCMMEKASHALDDSGCWHESIGSTGYDFDIDEKELED